MLVSRLHTNTNIFLTLSCILRQFTISKANYFKLLLSNINTVIIFEY